MRGVRHVACGICGMWRGTHPRRAPARRRAWPRRWRGGQASRCERAPHDCGERAERRVVQASEKEARDACGDSSRAACFCMGRLAAEASAVSAGSVSLTAPTQAHPGPTAASKRARRGPPDCVSGAPRGMEEVQRGVDATVAWPTPLDGAAHRPRARLRLRHPQPRAHVAVRAAVAVVVVVLRPRGAQRSAAAARRRDGKGWGSETGAGEPQINPGRGQWAELRGRRGRAGAGSTRGRGRTAAPRAARARRAARRGWAGRRAR